MRKTLLVLLACVVFLAGCATAHIKTDDDNGTTCEASYVSLFKDTTGISMGACGGGGQAQQTKSNTEGLKALLRSL